LQLCPAMTLCARLVLPLAAGSVAVAALSSAAEVLTTSTTSYLLVQHLDGQWEPSDTAFLSDGDQLVGLRCQASCTELAACRCTGWDSVKGQCWFRRDRDLNNITSGKTNAYIKVVTPWKLVGASFAGNILGAAGRVGTGGSYAMPQHPVTGISVQTTSPMKLSLTTFPAVDGSLADGFVLEHLSNGSWTIYGSSPSLHRDASNVSLQITWPTTSHVTCLADTWHGTDRVCGDCKVLVDNSGQKPYGTCSGYCASVGRKCDTAWQARGATCEEEHALQCGVFIPDNMICQCGAVLPRVIAVFDGDQVVLGKASEEAMHAQIALTRPNSSVYVKEIRPQPFFGEATTSTYRDLLDKNCYKPNARDLGKRSNVTAQKCQDLCTQDPECDCVTWGRGGEVMEANKPKDVHQCWMRADCYPHGIVSTNYDEGYNVYLKDRVRWQRMGMTFADNVFSRLTNAVGNGYAVSLDRVTSITVRLSSPSMVGFTSLAEPGTSLNSAFCISFSAESQQNLSQAPCRHYANGTVTLSIRDHKVFALLAGEEVPLGAATHGALYARLVLPASSSAVEVIEAVPMSLVPTVSPRPTTSPAPKARAWLTIGLPIIGAVLVCCMIAAGVCRGYYQSTQDGKEGSCQDHEDDLESSHGRSPQGPTDLPPMDTLTNEEKAKDPAWAAISLEQLNDLRDLARETLGSGFSTATLYDVNRAILQPMCEAHGKSYAHIVNSSHKGSTLKRLTVFVSHAWAENFDMFVSSINDAFRSWAIKPNIWICATALIQTTDPKIIAMQVGTGTDPTNAPFTKALAAAEKLLIVRNDAVDLYERIWCCWELFVAHQQGLVHRPGCLMVVGPAAAPGKAVDITRAKASNNDDKQKILVYVLSSNLYQVINESLTEIKYYGGSA